MNKTNTFELLVEKLQNGLLGWDESDQLNINGENGERRVEALVENMNPDMMSGFLPQEPYWFIDILDEQLGIEGNVLREEKIQEGDGKRCHFLVGARGKEGWAVDLSYFVSDEDYHLGNCWVHIIEGGRGVTNAVAAFDQGNIDMAATEIAKQIQEAIGDSPEKLIALREALSKQPAGRVALQAWDAVALGQQMEHNTPKARKTSPGGRL